MGRPDRSPGKARAGGDLRRVKQPRRPPGDRPHPLERLLIYRVWERMLEIEFVDRSVALAGEGLRVVLPARDRRRRVRSRAACGRRSSPRSPAGSGCKGDALGSHETPSPRPTTCARRPGCSASCSRSSSPPRSRRRCNAATARAWRRPPRSVGRVRAREHVAARSTGLHGPPRRCRAALGDGPGSRVFAVLAVALSAGLWWFTAWFLLLGECGRGSLPTGGDHRRRDHGVRRLRDRLDAGRGHRQRGAVRHLRHRPLVGDLVLRRGVLRPARRVRGTGLRRGHGAGRRAHPGSHGFDTDHGCSPPLPPPTRSLTLRDAFQSQEESAHASDH